MSPDRVDNLDNLAQNMDQRKPVFVDEKGQIHDARKMEELAQDGDNRPVTQFKPTTWFQSDTGVASLRELSEPKKHKEE